MSLQDKVNEANTSFAGGDYDGALARYEEAIALAAGKNGALSILHANKGAVLQRMLRLDDSITALTKSLEYNPKHTEALYNKGVALKSKGMHEDALADFEAAIEQKEDFYSAHCGKSEVLSALGRYDESITAAEAAVALAPDESQAYADRAFALLKQGRCEDAVADYRKVQSMGRQTAEYARLHATALSMIGVKQNEDGDNDKALATLQESLDLCKDLRTLFNRALILSKCERIEDAQKDLRSILVDDPTDGNAHAALGNMLASAGNFEEAYGHLEAASKTIDTVDAMPKGDLLHNMGYCLLKLARHDEALAMFRRVLEVDPEHEGAKAALAADPGYTPTAAASSTASTAAVAPPSPVPVAKTAAPAAPAAPAAQAAPSAPAAAKAATATSPLKASKPTPPASASAVAAAPPALSAPAESKTVDAPAATAATTGGATATPKATFPLENLQAPPFPDGVDLSKRESYLDDASFEATLGMDKISFYALPKWKQKKKKIETKLF